MSPGDLARALEATGGLQAGWGSELHDLVRQLPEHLRRVIVGPRSALATRTVPVGQINWLGDDAFAEAPDGGHDVLVKVRSTRPPKPARVHPHGSGAEVELLTPEEGVAPGQACVFYAPEGTRVLGGGWIGRS